jgi:hypothetical protein
MDGDYDILHGDLHDWKENPVSCGHRLSERRWAPTLFQVLPVPPSIGPKIK